MRPLVDGSVRERDRSLDVATVRLDDREHADVEAVAVDGVWCLVIGEDLVESALYFTIWDTEARRRTSLLLPSARPMIGLAHSWLPAVPPPAGGV